MILVQEIVNDNGILVVAGAFFTALFGAVSAIGVALVRNRQATEDLKSVTIQAAECAEQAQVNTIGVSNGFVGRMDSKLNQIIANQDGLEKAIRDHLDWHLNNR
jgi:hypothetical protein